MSNLTAVIPSKHFDEIGSAAEEPAFTAKKSRFLTAKAVRNDNTKLSFQKVLWGDGRPGRLPLLHHRWLNLFYIHQVGRIASCVAGGAIRRLLAVATGLLKTIH
jgi:hypothetical protein